VSGSPVHARAPSAASARLTFGESRYRWTIGGPASGTRAAAAIAGWLATAGQNAPVPFGVPRPVGPSQPVPAWHHYDVGQVPLDPVVTSYRATACAYG
jgi:hypothetical protein